VLALKFEISFLLDAEIIIIFFVAIFNIFLFLNAAFKSRILNSKTEI